MSRFARRVFTAIAPPLLTLVAARARAQGPQYGPNPALTRPYATPSATRRNTDAPWPRGRTPAAPAGFVVTRYAGGLDSPRSVYVLPNGDVLTAEARTERGSKSANRVTLLRDRDGDGAAESRHVLLAGLHQPFGLALIGDTLYVADTDGLLRTRYRAGDTAVAAPPRKILALPAGGYNNHWTRNLLVARDRSTLYVSVGSGSNVGEHGPANEVRRANILRVRLDGSGERVVAAGLRNPVGMAWNPATGALWTAVNERDELGDALVPDYITSVQPGAFYGWPYSYWGVHPDPRRRGERPDLVAKAVRPDYAMGAHTASLGLAFYDANASPAAFPEAYRGGAFVAQHGSWNRSAFSGFKVVFVPFRDGRPSGPARDFLTGFLPDPAAGVAYGRPVAVAVARDGALLVTDDTGGTIWRVAPAPR